MENKGPSIKQKKDSVLRVVNYLNKYIKIEKYKLEENLYGRDKRQKRQEERITKR